MLDLLVTRPWWVSLLITHPLSQVVLTRVVTCEKTRLVSLVSEATKLQQGNFRRATITDRENDCAESARDVDLGFVLAPQSVQDTAARSSSRVAIGSDRDLASMCMSAQHQIDAGAGRASEDDPIMSKQQFHLFVAGSGQSEGQILEPHHRIVHTREPERGAVLFKTHALIDQYLYALSAK